MSLDEYASKRSGTGKRVTVNLASGDKTTDLNFLAFANNHRSSDTLAQKRARGLSTEMKEQVQVDQADASRVDTKSPIISKTDMIKIDLIHGKNSNVLSSKNSVSDILLNLPEK